MNHTVIEQAIPGTVTIDRSWMTTFWETFSDTVIEMDADYIVTNILKKTDSTFTMDIIGRSFLDIVVQRERAFVAAELAVLRTTDAPFRRFTFLSKLGRYYRYTLVASRKNGIFTGLRGISVDVTRQSLNEITLNWQHEIIEENGDFITITDMDGGILYTNPGAYRMAGYDPFLDKMQEARIFTEEYWSKIRGEGMASVRATGSWTSLGELIRKDGSTLPIEYTMFSVKNEHGDTILIATIIRNITAFVQHEKKLEEARVAADVANAAKSEFLSRMSHEIRTPLNAIIGMIHIGMGTDDVDKKNHCFTKANCASKHLLGIINDILDMAKIEAKKLELCFTVFNFEHSLKDVADMANVRAAEKNQEFMLATCGDVPTFILGDELRLSQVITNLLSNAVKFTPENGKITLTVEKIEEDGDDITLKIEVADTGIGVSQEQQERLFKSFNQADSSISQRFGGTGLGLTISKQIVELMDGRIWIESELGKGAKFIFTAKVKKVEGAELGDFVDAAQAATDGQYDFSAYTLLIAEDAEINREVIAAVLERTSVAIDFAETGTEAVSLFAENPEKYDAVLMDINMPGIDGYEATRRIRAIEQEAEKDLAHCAEDKTNYPGSAGRVLRKQIPIIAMTANVFREDIEKCLTAGMNDHTGKPIDDATLLRQLSVYLK